MGGTWDLFRYPGVRSDSDMYTLGYRFRPWREAKAIAPDGPSIRQYLCDTAKEFGIDSQDPLRSSRNPILLGHPPMRSRTVGTSLAPLASAFA